MLNTDSVMPVPTAPPPVRTSDPDDDIVIATATAGRADVICTWDRDLLDAAVRAAQRAQFGAKGQQLRGLLGGIEWFKAREESRRESARAREEGLESRGEIEWAMASSSND